MNHNSPLTTPLSSTATCITRPFMHRHQLLLGTHSSTLTTTHHNPTDRFPLISLRSPHHIPPLAPASLTIMSPLTCRSSPHRCLPLPLPPASLALLCTTTNRRLKHYSTLFATHHHSLPLTTAHRLSALQTRGCCHRRRGSKGSYLPSSRHRHPPPRQQHQPRLRRQRKASHRGRFCCSIFSRP